MLQTVGHSTDFASFVLETGHEDIPASARQRAQDLILDLIGVSAAAHDLQASRIVREMAIRQFGAGSEADSAQILFDGRRASRSGAAYAGANQIDSLDAHDGYSLAKGHAGCGLLPGVLAFLDGHECSGEEFLTSMVLGYEIASRAGVALHATVSDYHTSGAWVALAVAALGIRLNGGDANMLRQAIGIAEYHGPRSQMMREIDNPTMLHDGSGWGAMVGVTSAELSLAGFEGAPALTVEREDAAPFWADLGQTWLVEEQNIKLFPVCRWAHAPIQAALDLRAQHGLQTKDIAKIEIHAFHEATRLAQDMPATTGKAQYSINYPVACALANGQVAAPEVSGEFFNDPNIADLVARIEVMECDHCNQNFPQDRLGRSVVVTHDGQRLDSGITRAPGEHTNPIGRQGIIDKFDAFVGPVLSKDRAAAIKDAVFSLGAPATQIDDLAKLLYPSPVST